MKKCQLLILGLVIFANSLAQTNPELIKKVWYKVKAERKDGSKIIDYFDTQNKFEMFIFSRDSFRYLNDPYDDINRIGKYSIRGNHLTLNSINYSIESLNEHMLIYTEELPDMADDEINRYYLVSSDFYLDSLIKNNLATHEKDTIVASFKYFPFLIKGGICSFIMEKLHNPTINGRLVGSFIISPDNQVEKIVIKEKEGINDKYLEKIKKAFKESSGQWIIPSQKDLFLKTNFVLTLGISNNGRLTQISNDFSIGDRPNKKSILSTKKLAYSERLFNKGISQLNELKYYDALESFSNCIEIDSISLFAYYNRAYVYLKINNIEKACSDWLYLSKLDQKKAKEYYQQNCKVK